MKSACYHFRETLCFVCSIVKGQISSLHCFSYLFQDEWRAGLEITKKITVIEIFLCSYGPWKEGLIMMKIPCDWDFIYCFKSKALSFAQIYLHWLFLIRSSFPLRYFNINFTHVIVSFMLIFVCCCKPCSVVSWRECFQIQCHHW